MRLVWRASLAHGVCRDRSTQQARDGGRIGGTVLGQAWSPAPPLLPPSMLLGQLSVPLAIESGPKFKQSIKGPDLSILLNILER